LNFKYTFFDIKINIIEKGIRVFGNGTDLNQLPYGRNNQNHRFQKVFQTLIFFAAFSSVLVWFVFTLQGGGGSSVYSGVYEVRGKEVKK
jgi:hypothetical protein